MVTWLNTMNLPMTVPPAATSGQASGHELYGRRGECDMLDQLVAEVRAGQNRALVVRGEPGAGKSTLLDYLARRVAGCRVVWVACAEPETEMAFAGLHQVCAPFLDRLGNLPDPQRDALLTAFSMQGGNVPDRSAVGMATLSLVSDLARKRPLVCLVDDAHWLDQASAQALTFVARHLTAVPAAVIFTAREPADVQGLAGLPEVQLGGLADADARALLDSVLIGPVDERVRNRIVAEARGNPRALLELPCGLTPGELAGGFGLPSAARVPGRIQERYRQQLALFPAATQLLLLIAAAEPTGDPVFVWRAAGSLGVQAEAADPAVAAGLAEFSGQVRFCHPQARAAVYRAATPQQRRSVHSALAQTADSNVSPDQRAWHRAQATPHLDEDVAAELIRAAGQAHAVGGLAAAAAFGERAAELTPEPACRARRALDAAQAKREAGAPDAARRLLALAQSGPLDELGRARAELLGAQLAVGPGQGLLLLEAARRLGSLGAEMAREAYGEAFCAALTARRLDPACEITQIAAAAKHAASAWCPSLAADLLLDGLATLVTDGRGASPPVLKRAVRAVSDKAVPAPDALRWLPFACEMSRAAWDDESWHVLSARLIELARRAGALTVLPDALDDGTSLRLATGETELATAMAREAETVAAATGNLRWPYAAVLVAGWRGQEADASRSVAVSMAESAAHGDGQRLTAVAWATAVLNNGLGRYEEALTAAGRASDDPDELGLASWSLSELIEAAARTGAPERASGALRRLSEATDVAATDWALGIQARSRALLSSDEDTERLYREAIERLARTRIRAELARAHLLYGEWLRRQGRRCDARAQLRTAYQMLNAMGMAGFAERARKELLATGETARKRTVETLYELTAQEAQIARLASNWRSNSEISAELFISPRTVEWHLSKVFAKLGIGSRRELRAALPDLDLIPVPA